ncbi:MAG: DUF167 domain-containing protein [Candidatus Coatesbacteria bacterium]|nr:DUF167 domain-containing protein [Candidatus Coatesbacteria bacterium]
MRKITVKVYPNSKRDEVYVENDILIVRTTKQAKEGKANDAVVKLLSKYFKIPISCISIKTGRSSKNKIVEIND